MSADRDRETRLAEAREEIARDLRDVAMPNVPREAPVGAAFVGRADEILRLQTVSALLRDLDTLRRDLAALAEELDGWRDNAQRFANSVLGDEAMEARALGRVRAYERSITGIRALLDGGEGGR